MTCTSLNVRRFTSCFFFFFFFNFVGFVHFVHAARLGNSPRIALPLVQLQCWSRVTPIEFTQYGECDESTMRGQKSDNKLRSKFG